MRSTKVEFDPGRILLIDAKSELGIEDASEEELDKIRFGIGVTTE